MNDSYDFEGMPVHQHLPEEFCDICLGEDARHVTLKRIEVLKRPEDHSPQALLDAGMWNFFNNPVLENPNDK